VVELPRGDRLFDRHQVGQLNHLALPAADVDGREVLGGRPVGVFDLDDDLVLLAVALEAGHLPAAEHGLQGPADGCHLPAHVDDLVAVHADGELRLVQLEVGVEVEKPRPLPGFRKDGLGDLLERFVRRGALDDELHRLGDGALAQRRRVDREGQDAGNAAEELGLQFLGDLLLLAVALFQSLSPTKEMICVTTG
jgi:hypothetical protein